MKHPECSNGIYVINTLCLKGHWLWQGHSADLWALVGECSFCQTMARQRGSRGVNNLPRYYWALISGLCLLLAEEHREQVDQRTVVPRGSEHTREKQRVDLRMIPSENWDRTHWRVLNIRSVTGIKKRSHKLYVFAMAQTVFKSLIHLIYVHWSHGIFSPLSKNQDKR